MREKVPCPDCGKLRTWRQMPEHLQRDHSCTEHQVARSMAKLEKQYPEREARHAD